MRFYNRFHHTSCAAGLWQTTLLALLLASVFAEQLENGLDIETTKHGNCAHQAQNGDVISMHYKGSLASGTVFDANRDDDEPFEFELGAGSVIEGWELGLLGTCLGEERRLVIPPKVCRVLLPCVIVANKTKSLAMVRARWVQYLRILL